MEIIQRSIVGLTPNLTNFAYTYLDNKYHNIEVPLISNKSLFTTFTYIIALGALSSLSLFIKNYQFIAALLKFAL